MLLDIQQMDPIWSLTFLFIDQSQLIDFACDGLTVSKLLKVFLFETPKKEDSSLENKLVDSQDSVLAEVEINSLLCAPKGLVKSLEFVF